MVTPNTWDTGKSSKGGSAAGAVGIGAVLGGAIGSAATSHVSARAYGKMAEVHKGVITHETDQAIRFAGAMSGHGQMSGVNTRVGSATYHKADNDTSGQPNKAAVESGSENSGHRVPSQWAASAVHAAARSAMSKPKSGQAKAASAFGSRTSAIKKAHANKALTPAEYMEETTKALAARTQGMGKPKRKPKP